MAQTEKGKMYLRRSLKLIRQEMELVKNGKMPTGKTEKVAELVDSESQNLSGGR